MTKGQTSGDKRENENTQRVFSFDLPTLILILLLLLLLIGFLFNKKTSFVSLEPSSNKAHLTQSLHENPLKSLQASQSDLANQSHLANQSLLVKQSNHGYGQCTFTPNLKNQCFSGGHQLCEADLEAAKIAWKYFENNYQAETGLFNAVNNYPSTTLWDTGSALAATIAAHDLGFIDSKEFDEKITALIKTLVKIKLFNDEAPNKVYHSKTLKMVNYANKPLEDGVGVSILDLARMMSWLNTLTCKYPRYTHQVKLALKRWDFKRLVKEGRMFGLKKYEDSTKVFQEGRLGYEQYAGKILSQYGFQQHVAATYNNKFRQNIEIHNTMIATDSRHPKDFGANNSVVSESYILDAMENGVDTENQPLIQNIFEVQKQRWRKTGIITAVSEDNINRKPYFVYNTIYSGGQTWVAKSSKGENLKKHKTISTKAAISFATLFPNDEYSHVLMDKVQHAYHKDKGWYSGVYENGEGYNTSLTANTNGVILTNFLFKKYGSMYNVCDECQKKLVLRKKKICSIDSACQ